MKKGLWILSIIAVIFLSYYLFIRPFEFGVKFKANTLPGDVIGTIRIWNRSLDGARINKVDSFRSLKQTFAWKDKTYTYDWHFTTINDSITQVNVQISEPNRRLLNKLLVPFSDQQIEKDAGDIVREFDRILQDHLKITHVEMKGEAQLKPLFCVCRTLETSQIEKANGMMKDFPLLTSFVNNFNLKSNGPPIVKVLEWNHNLGTLKYDFCFPILKTDSLPESHSTTYKQFGTEERVLKAEYYGNYITSDRAWYELVHYANRNGYKIKGLPIEYFHSNPNLGINESEWKAEVYLPVEK